MKRDETQFSSSSAQDKVLIILLWRTNQFEHIDWSTTNKPEKKKKTNIKATFRNSSKVWYPFVFKMPLFSKRFAKMFKKNWQSPLFPCQETRPSRLLDLQSTLMDLRFSPKATTFNVSYPLRIHGTGILTYMNGWFLWVNVGKYIYIYHTWILWDIFTNAWWFSRRDLFESPVVGGHLNNLWVRVTNLTMPKRSPAELPESWWLFLAIVVNHFMKKPIVVTTWLLIETTIS